MRSYASTSHPGSQSCEDSSGRCSDNHPHHRVRGGDPAQVGVLTPPDHECVGAAAGNLIDCRM